MSFNDVNPYQPGSLALWPEEKDESADTRRARRDAQNALDTVERMRGDRNKDPQAYGRAINDFHALNQNLRKAQNQDTRNRYLAGLAEERAAITAHDREVRQKREAEQDAQLKLTLRSYYPGTDADFERDYENIKLEYNRQQMFARMAQQQVSRF